MMPRRQSVLERPHWKAYPLNPDAPGARLRTRREVLHIRLRRGMSNALILSVLLHLLAIYLLSRQHLFDNPPLQANQTLLVQLAPPQPPKATRLPEPPAPKPIEKPVAPKPRAPKAEPRPKAVSAPPKVAALPPPPIANSPQTAPIAPTKPEPAPKAPAATDMMAYVNAQRARRNVNETASPASPPPQPERAPTEDEIRMANIQRNLQTPGQNGIFQILSKDNRAATLSFRGWKNDASNSRREVIPIEVGPGGDIERAIVRKMIEVIRRYYTGDFNWESYRMGRVVILSARPQDNDGLEDFLIQEFFLPDGSLR